MKPHDAEPPVKAVSGLDSEGNPRGGLPAVAPRRAKPTIHDVDLGRLKLSLVVLQFAAVATLLRSIAYDYWITVLASVLLLAGATEALEEQ